MACLLALGGAPSASARDGVVTSFDGTRIVYSFFPAHGLADGRRVPTVMVGPGYSSGRADDADPNVKGLLDNGYNVLTWDPRGFGQSSGQVEIDSAEYEGRDASALIDVIAQQPEVQLDQPGDPRLGMAGASYGGGIQWVTAATDNRVDVIAPSISWHSLVTSLDKNNTAKAGWGSLLFGLGVQGTTVPGVTGGADGSPNGFQFGRQQDPRATQALIDGAATGTFTAADQEFFASRGPGDLVRAIRVPTLITQSSSDTLFTLNEAIENYKLLRANRVPVKMVWFCGSLTTPSEDVAHGLCNSDAGPDSQTVLHETLNWMNRWLKAPRVTPRPRDTGQLGPRFQWVSQDGVIHAGDDYPLPGGPPVVADGSGPLTLIPGSASGTLIAAGSAANSVTVPLPAVANPTQIVGEPQLRLEYTGTAASADARVYAQIVDATSGQVVGPVVTPVPLALDGRPQTLELPIEGVALTATPDSRYALQITDGTTVYSPQRQAGVVNFSRITLTAPTVSPAVASGNSAPEKCVDGRKFKFRIHQNRKRIVRVRVYIDKKLAKTVRGRRVTRVAIKRLPQGIFRVKIVAVASNGQRVISVRTYRGCQKSPPRTAVRPPRG
jgi:ABC-2 type transport system ATP-binding protein